MASMNIENLADLVELTLNDYKRGDYVSLLTDLTRHYAAKQFVKKSRMESQAGPYFEWKVRMGTADSFEFISPTTPDFAEMTDDFEAARVPRRKMKVSYAFLEEQVDFNQGANQIVNLVKAKEDGADFDWVEGFESAFWQFPLATNTLSIYGLPYWCTKNATTGFTGGIPTGYSDVGGLSPTTFPRWNNYAGLYVSVTLDDLIRKARTMAEETDFEPPVSAVPDLGSNGNSNSVGYYTNLTVKQTFEDVADSRNDNLGPDVAKHDNMVMFRRAPIHYVPWLKRDTTNPFYQINWNVFKLIVQRKWWQRRTIIKPVPGQRNQVAVYKDTYCQTACFNRRLLGVLATATTYTGA